MQLAGTPLHVAVKAHQECMVHELLAHDADVNAADQVRFLPILCGGVADFLPAVWHLSTAFCSADYKGDHGAHIIG